MGQKAPVSRPLAPTSPHLEPGASSRIIHIRDQSLLLRKHPPS